tara:strand:+ start:163 stop:363 length:201 start_codon:yes stop_codon:yes gene_type:complete
MRLSDQALGAVMLALQKSLMTQTDITPILKGFDFMMDDTEELIVLNPPTLDMSERTDEVNNTVGSD